MFRSERGLLSSGEASEGCSDTPPNVRIGRVAALRWLIVLAGTALFALLVGTTGIGVLAHDLGRAGPALLPYIVLTGLENVFHALGARWCFSRRQRSAVPFGRLFLICQAGMALNWVTPSAEIAGEVARGLILQRYVSGAEAASVVIINKFTFSMARMLAAGTLTAWTMLLFPPSRLHAWALGIGAAVITLGLLGFAAFQAFGLLGAIVTRLARLGGPGLEAWARLHVGPLDAQLRAYYREHGRDALVAIGWDLVGFTIAIAQRTYMMSVLMAGVPDAPPVTLLRGTAVWAITSLLDMLFFFVTGGLGVLEAAHQLAFQAVGLPGAKGIALSLVARLNQLVWVVIGLTAYWSELAGSVKGRGQPGRDAGDPS
jgi:glycosyltransferase 2 family protein